MPDRVFNFSPGPAVLPLPVLEQAQRELVSLPGVGMSMLEISHRSKPFDAILAETTQGLRELLGVPDGYHILFLQGGSSLQFYMLALNLLKGPAKPPTTSSPALGARRRWTKPSAKAKSTSSGTAKPPTTTACPKPAELKLNPDAAYLHFTDNETIQGVEFPSAPDAGNVPLVCDASSNFLSRPMPIERYGLIYACAQKNAGPAGVTVVIIREDLIAARPEEPAADARLSQSTSKTNRATTRRPPSPFTC